MDEWLIAPLSAVCSILFGIVLFYYVERQKEGNIKMQDVARTIQDGANTFLRRELKLLAVFVLAFLCHFVGP